MREEYQNARKLGVKEYKRLVLEGKNPYPTVLDRLLEGIETAGELPMGIYEIPLEDIVGTRTAGRTNSFAANFMPILGENTEFAQKWWSLCDSQMEEGIRDPIKCYEFMNRFYVQEGNKRVSVSKYVGATSILADVIRILPKRIDDDRVRAYYEFHTAFNVFPVYDFYFSVEGFYPGFADMLGRNMEDPWPDDLLKRIRACFAAFSKCYAGKGGGHLELTAGDAFFIYSRVFGMETLLEDTDAVIGQKVTRLWEEFLTSRGKIKLQDTPEEPKKQTFLLDLFTRPGYSRQKPLHAVFLYAKDPENDRWTYGHELGRNYVETHFRGLVKTSRFDNCESDEALEQAFARANEEKADLVFTTAASQIEGSFKAGITYPSLRVLNCSVNVAHSSVRTYYGRMHEAKFLMGALAASLAENHRIGYRAGAPIYGALSHINAFAIGAAMVDPLVKVHLKWAGVKDSRWKEELEEENVRIISGPDMIQPTDTAREYGLYRVRDDGSIEVLAAPVWDWGKYYERIIHSVLAGEWESAAGGDRNRAINYWWGMSAGVVDVILSDHLSYYSKKMMAALKEGIINGGISPFAGEIHSLEGLVREASAPRMTNHEIVTINWLNDNIEGRIPSFEELDGESAIMVKQNGIAL